MRRIVRAALLITMCLTALLFARPVRADADDETRWRVTGASSGGGFTYEIYEDGGIGITGAKKDVGGALTVPEEISGRPVRRIAPGAFSGSAVTTVTLPDSVESIGPHAFGVCMELYGVSFGAGLTEIGECAFSECSALKAVFLPEGVLSVGDGAFSFCSSMTAFTFSRHLVSVGAGAFEACSALTAAQLPEGLSFIGDYAFSACASLHAITLPTVSAEIGRGAFHGTPWLDARMSNARLSTGGWLSLCGTRYLYVGSESIVTVPAEYAAFDFTESGAERVILSDGIEAVPDAAFAGLGTLVSVSLSADTKTIGAEAFTGCRLLREIDWGGAETIGKNAFSGCAALTALTLPEGVKVIGDGAFSGCSHLTALNASGLNVIGNGAFEGCRRLYEIVLPEGLESIGDGAFRTCAGLERAVLPEHMTAIGREAFADCEMLTEILPEALPEGLESIGCAAFRNTPWLAAQTDACAGDWLTLGGVLSVYTGSAYTLDIPSGFGAFDLTGAVSVRKLKIGAAVIPAGACAGLTGLGVVTFGDGVEEIRDSAFFGCSDIRAVELPASVRSIGESAFAFCDALKTVTAKEGLEEIGSGAFAYCNSLKSVRLPKSLTALGEGIFSYSGDFRANVPKGSAIERYLG